MLTKASIPKIRLLENEKILACYQPSRFQYLKTYILIFFIVLLKLSTEIFGLGVFFFIVAILILRVEIHVRFTRYIITNTRCITNWVFITRNFRDVPLNKIQNTYFTQGIIERIFHYGTLLIDSAGGPGKEIRFEGFTDFEEAHEIIQKQLQ